MPMPELTLRRATAADAPLLAEMEKVCFTDPWDLAAFEGLLANPASYFIIAENNGIPVAYGGMLTVIDECEILNVAVTDGYRRMGIGRILVSEMLDICRNNGVTAVFLEHRESNTAAASLYESLGFEAYAIRRRYYTSPVEDAVLRKLAL